MTRTTLDVSVQVSSDLPVDVDCVQYFRRSAGVVGQVSGMTVIPAQSN